MFQQQPVPDEGELFAPDKLGLRDHTGDIFQRVRAWDLAGTVEGDWTCGVLIGRTKDGKFVVIDVKRGFEARRTRCWRSSKRRRWATPSWRAYRCPRRPLWRSAEGVDQPRHP
jgi:hypothetical protein